jgi:predicted MFS family arabinose efflux permease
VLRAILEAYRSAFSGLPREVWLLASVSFVNRAGTMVLPFLALYLVREIGCTPAEAGIVLSLYGAGGVAGSLLGGALVDRVGPRVVQTTSLVLNGIGLFALGLLTTRAQIALLAPALGLVTELFRPANAAALAAVAEPSLRARAFALGRFAINLGMAIGPTIGGLLATVDYGLLFVIDGATCLLAAAVLLATSRGPSTARAARSDADVALGRHPARDLPFLAACLLFFAFASVLFQLLGTWPLYLREVYGLEERHIGLLFGLNTLCIALFEMLSVQRIGSRPPLPFVAVGSALLCASFALLPFGRGFAWAAGSVLVWTVGEILSMSLAASFVSARAGPGRLGAYMGFYLTAFSSAFVAAPALGTRVYERIGPDVLWYGCGAVGVAAYAAFRAVAAAIEREPAAAGGQGSAGRDVAGAPAGARYPPSSCWPSRVLLARATKIRVRARCLRRAGPRARKRGAACSSARCGSAPPRRARAPGCRRWCRGARSRKATSRPTS